MDNYNGGKSGTYVSYHYSQVKPDITDMFRIVPLTFHYICYTLTGILISSYTPFRVFHYSDGVQYH